MRLATSLLALALVAGSATSASALTADQIIGDWQCDAAASEPAIKAMMEQKLEGRSDQEKQSAQMMMPMILQMISNTKFTMAKDSLEMHMTGPDGQPQIQKAAITNFASTGDATADVTTRQEGETAEKTAKVSLGADGKLTIEANGMPLIFAKAAPAAK